MNVSICSETAKSLEAAHLLQNYDRYDLVVERGEGCYLIDVEGRRYLDMIAGIGVNALGYGHPRITAALIGQARECVHTSNLMYHRHQGPLAEKLCAMSSLDRAFFSNSGTEAMEAALKAVRSHWNQRDPRRTRLVALERSFHGRTMGSLAITGQEDLRAPFAPFAGPVTFVEANDHRALRASISEETAAVVLEPVLGEGGIWPLTDAFLREAREWTAQQGALLVADETQCGLGRTGRHFAYQWAGIRPDVVATAKPLGGGLPIGATLFTEDVAASLPVHKHGTTFGGGPLACRVALEFLRVMDELLPSIAARGEELRSALEWLKSRHASIAEIRGKGMMLGIQMTAPAHGIVRAARDRGLLVNCTQGSVIRLLPPYILSSEEAQAAVRILDEVLP